MLLEHPDFVPGDASRVPRGATVVAGDLADGTGSWVAALRGADSLVHFSAVNPYPNASWEDSAGSMAHTFNALCAASGHRVRRVVLASSNHVMGGYKDVAGAEGDVTPATPPLCGTLLQDPAATAKSGDAVAYAAAKLAGEQMCRTLAARGGAASLLKAAWPPCVCAPCVCGAAARQPGLLGQNKPAVGWAGAELLFA